METKYYVILNNNGERVSPGYPTYEEVPEDIKQNGVLVDKATFSALLNGYRLDPDSGKLMEIEHTPSIDVLKSQAIAQAYDAYQAEKYAPVWVGDIGFLTTDEGQQNWQTGIALLTDGQTELQVLIDKNDLTKKEIRTVTQVDMLEAGKAARASQYAAYERFKAQKERIKLCDTAAAVRAYITEEHA